MRKIKGDHAWWRQTVKNVPDGVCSTCGGKGRYKRTFKHKNPIITFCIECKGTGKVDRRVRYLGESDYEGGLINDSNYTVISETEEDYVVSKNSTTLIQMKKELFETVKH